MKTCTINSEKSSEHWPFFNVTGECVLDIGCGRYNQSIHEEFSPIYFKSQGAAHVVGIDSDPDSISYYKETTKDDDSFTFYNTTVSNMKQITDLIKSHNITAIKCDIEGGEVVLFDATSNDLADIKYLAIEYHTTDIRDKLLSLHIDWGFVLTWRATFKNTPASLGVLYFERETPQQGMPSEIENLINIPDNILSVGWGLFDKHMAMQNKAAFGAIYDLINDIKPARIIEIGTAGAGLTRFFRYCCNDLNLNSKIITYDVHKTKHPPDGVNETIDYRYKNCFGIVRNPGNKINQDELIAEIQGEGKVILLCDGGNKIHEFNTLADYIKPGDIIMAHDYAHSTEVFVSEIKDKAWNWNEIRFDTISDAVAANDLVYYNPEVYKYAAWGCFIRT